MRRRILALAALLFLAFSQSSSAQWRPGGVMRIVLLVDSSSTTAPMVTSIRAQRLPERATRRA
jgi:hypothetical protein